MDLAPRGVGEVGVTRDVRLFVFVVIDKPEDCDTTIDGYASSIFVSAFEDAFPSWLPNFLRRKVVDP